ncbi:MAG TPA: hypothetical protein VGG08_00715 [Solirubrobacteraceae bacterium]|jgi:hypothetical protein
MRARLLAFPAAALAALLAGCGGITAPDLFIVYRSGDGPSAHLTLIVDEEGGVRCNGKEAKQKLSDPQIIKARTIQEDLEKPASQHTSLPARRGSVLSYYVRDENGSVRFSDNSAGQPAVFRQMALFVLEASQQVCHLAE